MRSHVEACVRARERRRRGGVGSRTGRGRRWNEGEWRVLYTRRNAVTTRLVHLPRGQLKAGKHAGAARSELARALALARRCTAGPSESSARARRTTASKLRRRAAEGTRACVPRDCAAAGREG